MTIAKFCPNLRKLSVGFKGNELETLKMVFNSCQNLESIKIWCGGNFLSENEALEIFVKYSPKNIHELILYHMYYVQQSELLLPEELESFFVSWTNHIPLSLVIVKDNSDILSTNDKYMIVIEKYIELGIIKKFKVTDYDDEVYGLV